jgi:O-acetylhomoserine/O-acetylserine sulfhydrylase-like pyridoxal-dependent enzyme
MLQGFLYSRHGNPTRQILEKGLAVLEDAKYSLCFASGSSAIGAIVQLLNSGEHIVSSELIFGGTYQYFSKVRCRCVLVLVEKFASFMGLECTKSKTSLGQNVTS